MATTFQRKPAPPPPLPPVPPPPLPYEYRKSRVLKLYPLPQNDMQDFQVERCHFQTPNLVEFMNKIGDDSDTDTELYSSSWNIWV